MSRKGLRIAFFLLSMFIFFLFGGGVVAYRLFPYSLYLNYKKAKKSEDVNYVAEYYKSKKYFDKEILVDSISPKSFRLALGFPQIRNDSVNLVYDESTLQTQDSIQFITGKLVLTNNFSYKVIRAYKDSKREKPAIIVIHGRESTAEKVLTLDTLDYTMGIGHAFAEKDYDVWAIEVNPFGNNEEFAKELYSRGISSTGIDLFALECLLRLIRKESEYIGVYGISYGGYLAELSSTLRINPDFIISSGGGFRGNFQGFQPIGGYFYKYPPILGLFYNSNLFVEFLKDIPLAINLNKNDQSLNSIVLIEKLRTVSKAPVLISTSDEDHVANPSGEIANADRLVRFLKEKRKQ